MLTLLIYVWANIIPHLQMPNIIGGGVSNESFASSMSKGKFSE